MTESTHHSSKSEIYLRIKTSLGDGAESIAKEFVSAFGGAAVQRAKEKHPASFPAGYVINQLANAVQREENPLTYDLESKGFTYIDHKGQKHYVGGLHDTTLDKDPLIEYILQLVDVNHNHLSTEVFSEAAIKRAAILPEHRIKRDLSVLISLVGDALLSKNSPVDTGK